jgi:Zn ribbon nucleic-acid-binding protein
MSEADDLRAELAVLRETNARLRAEITALRTRGLSEKPSSAQATGAAAIAPALWEHNRRFAMVTGGKVAGVVCPHCRASGDDVQMVRELGAGSAVAQERGYELEEVTCPRCLFTGWLRSR